jgi:hypothetical protein
MALSIRNEGPRISSTQNEMNSTSSKEKTSVAQETSQTQQPANTDKQTKAAQDLANAKRFDGSLQAISQQMRLKDFSAAKTNEQQTPSAYTGGGGTKALPKNDSTPVSQSYAAKTDKNELSDKQVAENQAIVDTARTYGRHEEKSWQFGSGTIKEFVEYLPGKGAWNEDIGDMQVFLRNGTELTKGDEILRTTNYFDPSHPGDKLGTVFSSDDNRLP